jgi:hypothetical protein
VDLKRSLIFLLFISLGLALTAQKPHIYGKVIDKETYSGLPNVNISFAGTTSGCVTDREGEFSVYLDTIPVYMIISHLGYETQRIWLENASGGVNILMKPVAKLLQEVEIRARKEPVPFFKDDQYAVLDYEVDNTLVYLLIYRFRLARAELICKSDQGDTIASSGNLNFRPAGLYADCLGYIHVLSADSAYQVFLNKDTIIFPHKADINKFQSTMSNCLVSTEELLFFREESYDHLTVNFFSINKITKQKYYIASLRDEARTKMLQKNPIDQYFLYMDTIADGNIPMVDYAFIRQIVYKPNASVLEKIGDTLAVFNTTDGTIDLYNLNGMYISGLKLPLRQSNEEKWTREIFVDQIAHIPYTTFIKNGRSVLYRIDLNNGELNFALSTNHIYPRKLRIHDNFLFYLYDLPGTGDNKHLFRQKI